MDTSATPEKPVETAADQSKLCEPLDEQETLLLDEVAQVYFKKVSGDMRGRVGLRPAEQGGSVVPNQQQIDALCTLGHSIHGIVAHAENIRKFKSLPDKITLPQDQPLYLEVLFKLNEVLEGLEDIAQRIEALRGGEPIDVDDMPF